MPVIAESPPLIFGGNQTPETPPPYIQPSIPPTPIPPTPIYAPPSESCNFSSLLNDHRIFIERVDQLGACFSRDTMPELSDMQFQIHTDIAMTDKYLTTSENMFCSKQAVENLSQKLKRYKG